MPASKHKMLCLGNGCFSSGSSGGMGVFLSCSITVTLRKHLHRSFFKCSRCVNFVIGVVPLPSMISINGFFWGETYGNNVPSYPSSCPIALGGVGSKRVVTRLLGHNRAMLCPKQTVPCTCEHFFSQDQEG